MGSEDFCFFSGCVDSWLVLGFLIGEELRSGGWAPLVHALAKTHVLVDELLGLSSLMCFCSACCFALRIIRFLRFSFFLQALRLESQRIPPFFGSQAFLAFLASATAFLQSVFHQICGGSRLIFLVGLLSVMELCSLAVVKAFWMIWKAAFGFLVS